MNRQKPSPKPVSSGRERLSAATVTRWTILIITLAGAVRVLALEVAVTVIAVTQALWPS